MFCLKSCQMYVPGTLENTKSVLVNIGTGYFVEKVSACMYSFLFIKYITHVGGLVFKLQI